VSAARKTVDVSGLPRHVFGARSLLFWGVALLVCIEVTAFALLLASYGAARQLEAEWPPTGPGRAAATAAAVEGLLLAISVWPMARCARAARRLDRRATLLWLSLATALGAAFLVLRYVELRWLPFRWDLHAYGSVFWVLVGMHTMHGIAAMIENLLLLAALGLHHPIEDKEYVDVYVGAIYWGLVVGSWWIVGGVLYLDGWSG
jgi:cytochrome c oxidase subunit I+III